MEEWQLPECLSVQQRKSRTRICLFGIFDQPQASSNVRMTPCDDTANSTRWCCGTNKDCCAGDVGVETLAQTFLGAIATSTSALSLSVSSTASTSPSISAPISSADPSSSNTGSTNQSTKSSSLSGGAIAGIVIGALAGIALIGATWFIIARRRRSSGPSPPAYAEEGHQTAAAPKTQYAYEADGINQQVSEVSAANTKDHDGRARVYEM